MSVLPGPQSGRANKVTASQNGNESVPAMALAILPARTSIMFETFICRITESGFFT